MKPGDILTQDGTDKYLVTEVDDKYGLVAVRCVKESEITSTGWPLYKLNDEFEELQRRFDIANVELCGESASPQK